MKHIQTFEDFLNEGGPHEAPGSVYGATSTNTSTGSKHNKGFVITNGEEWYAGAKNYLAFAKHYSQSNLYPTYDRAQKALFDEIPDKTVKDKKLKIERF